ncbi:mannitol dehydrogenase [Seonamhaeicola sp. S2-3]|uniref:mannitol dehydrogenase family protein n=1 Tax=Seonamhaeicola sp. S2-3 TaxID=1936081 RepID=UPI000972895C|nr:mannitol dehydrogenase family protein [Seonamhaeicola sp. S2-3]APY09840.1 mannitol dehydrogenase [Seonamhaeicola sp. S2-3]
MKNLKLNSKNLSAIAERVKVPTYDRSTIKTGIVHVGIGGFHRAHQAYYTDQLLHNENIKDWGICGVALLDFDTKIYQTLKNQDGLYTLVVKELDGTLTKQVIGSIVEYLFAPQNPTAVIEKMASPEVKIITLTITEGGYNYNEATKAFDFSNLSIIHDLEYPKTPKTIFGYLTQALKLRKKLGLKGVTIQSCDNIQGNGDMTKKMLLSYIRKAEPELVSWVETNVSFPNAMVDRITPVTSVEDITHLKETSGIDDAWPVVCESFKQWIIEDDFVAGRPPWEKVGVQFVEDVEPFEKMKLQLLNAGHSVLGILGALIGYNTIDEAANNKSIKNFLKIYMRDEVAPILRDLKGVDLESYEATLLERFGNIYIKDQIERICSESSSKIPIFILPTVKAQLKENGSITYAAFVIAAWCKYNLGKDEYQKPLVIKDVMANILHEQALKATNKPETFLQLETVFGGLSASNTFVKAYAKAYNDIVKYGVEKCVKEMNNKVLTEI